MGVWNHAAIVVGATKTDFGDLLLCESNYGYNDLIENRMVFLGELNFDVFCSDYDTCKSDRYIFGYKYVMTEMDSPLEISVDNERIADMVNEFTKRTGIQGKVYLMPHQN